MAKEITVAVYHRGRRTEYTGTVDYLAKDVFGYKLECGHSYNPRINRHPKTAKSLVSALNKAVDELQGGCFERDSYELVR